MPDTSPTPVDAALNRFEQMLKSGPGIYTQDWARFIEDVQVKGLALIAELRRATDTGKDDRIRELEAENERLTSRIAELVEPFKGDFEWLQKQVHSDPGKVAVDRGGEAIRAVVGALDGKLQWWCNMYEVACSVLAALQGQQA